MKKELSTINQTIFEQIRQVDEAGMNGGGTHVRQSA